MNTSTPPSRRLLVVASLVVLTVAVSALSAAGDPVQHDLPPHDVVVDTTFPGGVFCDFDVALHLTGKEGAISFGDGAVLIYPATMITLTNLDPDADATLRLSLTGPGRYVPDFEPDGSGTLTIHQWGRWLHPHAGDGIFLASGYGLQTVYFEAGGTYLDDEEDLSRTRITDLCAELAG